LHITPVRLLWLLRRSLGACLDDGCFGYAKAAAYSALLAFFPVIAATTTILVEARADFVLAPLRRALEEIAPPETGDLIVQRFRVAGAQPIYVLVVAVLIALWAASGVYKSLIEGFHAAYRVPRSRGFLHQNGVAIALVLASATPMLLASLAIIFGTEIERVVLRSLKMDPFLVQITPVWHWLSRVVRYLVAFSATVSVTAVTYYFGPYRRQRWHFVWPGALLATGLWLPATSGFGWYVRNVAHYNVMYGSIGAGVALLVWMYVMAVIALIGCEFNAVYERIA
jgi:membrane protein